VEDGYHEAMSDDTPESLIPYDEIVQEALRDVVGRVLSEVERSGGQLPGGMPGLPGLGGSSPFNLPPGFDKFGKK
jgi:hypothetical protein